VLNIFRFKPFYQKVLIFVIFIKKIVFKKDVADYNILLTSTCIAIF